ncbi:MAG: hypothetical protein K0S49_736 [Microbacterium sp.]|nr:hypothetical protein [Microbacterium sp.]
MTATPSFARDAAAVYVAPIVTMDAAAPDADAFAVHGGRIIAVGTVDAVRAAAPDADLEELEGVVLPGLIDAHMHMERAGLKALDYVSDEDDVDTYLQRMRDSFDDDGPEDPPFEDRIRALVRVQPLLHSLGITGVVDPAVTIDEMRGYQEAHRRGLLTMRTVAMPFLDIGTPRFPDIDAAIEHLDGTGVSTGFGDDMLRIGPIKVYADGEALKGQALLEQPWDNSGYAGLQRISDDDFTRLVEWCGAHGWGVGTHAVGGGAVALLARAYARAGDALGERAERANPVRSWLDAGAVLALGSDGPFFAFDPRHLMWQTITRRIAGEDEPLSMAEAITIEEALAGYTTGAAYASLAERDRGAIRVGMQADWALWSADPRTVATDALRTLAVRRTEVGGRTVHGGDS